MTQHQKSSPALVVLSPALIVPLPALIIPASVILKDFHRLTPLSGNECSNKLAPNVPNNIRRIPPLYSFGSFLIVSLTLFINKPNSSRDLIIFVISSTSSFEIINVVIPDLKAFFWIAASLADAGSVNPDGFKTLLANGLSTFYIKGKPFFSNGPRNLPKNSPNCPILDSEFLINFISADKPFSRTLLNLETCVLVNNNFCGKLASSLELPIKFDEWFKVTSVPFSIPISI